MKAVRRTARVVENCILCVVVWFCVGEFGECVVGNERELRGWSWRSSEEDEMIQTFWPVSGGLLGLLIKSKVQWTYSGTMLCPGPEGPKVGAGQLARYTACGTPGCREKRQGDYGVDGVLWLCSTRAGAGLVRSKGRRAKTVLPLNSFTTRFGFATETESVVRYTGDRFY